MTFIHNGAMIGVFLLSWLFIVSFLGLILVVFIGSFSRSSNETRKIKEEAKAKADAMRDIAKSEREHKKELLNALLNHYDRTKRNQTPPTSTPGHV